LIAEFKDDPPSPGFGATSPPTLAILKHTNPCGVGQGANLREAWDKAFATDRQAPFGGIIAVNQPLDGACAEAIVEIFSEVIIAPEFTAEALAVLRKKKNLRLMKMLRWGETTGEPAREDARPTNEFDVRSVGADSFLLQQRDLKTTAAADLKIVTKRQPTEAELKAMLFGWRVVKHLKSNAILYCGADRTLGTGAGQMSRVDSSRIAVWKAGEAKLPLKGSVVCSDAFFPFPDGLIAAADAGATAAIQPGGSVKDAEVIAAADERGMTMAFTGTRHFRH
jgi:phosphoribosylaminoimidazolecarboxamide formyltransferase/IMP cyclohydrolase